MNIKRQFTILPTDSNTAIIPLTQGKVALVDTADAIELCKYNWCAVKGKNGTYYAVSAIESRDNLVKMHRFLLKPETWEVVDHKDYDGLNNRRSNLRKATYSQNNQNKRELYSSLSKYRGVSKRGEKSFVAKLQHKRKQLYIGMYPSEQEAALAYNEKAKELFGEFAILNIVE